MNNICGGYRDWRIDGMYNTRYCMRSSERIEELAGYMEIKTGFPTVVEVNKGIVLPRKVSGGTPYQGLGGVVSSENEFVRESVIYDLKTKRDKDRIAFGGKYDVKQVEHSEKTAIYLGLAHTHWGHFLIDIVQRSWYPLVKGLLQGEKRLYSGYYDDLEIPDNYVFAFSGFGNGSIKFSGNCEAFFRLLGLDKSRILFVNTPTEFEKVIVPNVAVYPGEYIYTIYKEIFDTVIQNGMKESAELVPKENIYFSRAHLHDAKDIGEKSIESLMRSARYEILYPEELSLVEQIFYWQTAKNVACINGTIPHNCVFASKKVNLTIFNKMHNLFGYQFTMDRVHGTIPVYVDACYEPFERYPLSVSRGPFWIEITQDVVNYARECLNVEVSTTTRTCRDWAIYLKQCLVTELRYHLRGSKAKLKKLVKI